MSTIANKDQQGPIKAHIDQKFYQNLSKTRPTKMDEAQQRMTQADKDQNTLTDFRMKCVIIITSNSESLKIMLLWLWKVMSLFMHVK